MKYQLVTLIFTLFLLSTESFFSREYFETIKLTKGGDAGCAACTIVISIIEQMAEIHHKEVEQVLDEICKLFPTGVDATCQFYVDNYGDLIIHYFNMGFSPDAVCHAIKICTDPKCRIDGDTEEIDLMEIQRVNEAFGIKIEDAKARFDPWDWIQKIINLIADHYPVVDFDGDRFSTLPGLRGVNWRGRDCNDGDATIYPGRKASRYDSSVDHNCNGIKGSTNGKSYEDLYCTGTGQMGVAVIGDSAGAHFSIPPEYMSPKDINGRTYSDILSVLSNEFDWPHKSAYTAFVNGTKDSPVSSVYQYMKQRNLCNHRDYQNLAVNGARSGAVNNELVNTLRRDKNNDHPILLFIELIGNDVCSPHPNFDHMTTVDEFRKNILGILNTLTNVLPNGSHVVFIGLVDGRVLWDNLYNRTHPMGYTYRQVYDYLNCLGINPCWVWMNSNETVRNIGTQRAMDLNTVYPEIVKNQNYPNFDVTYYPFPFIQIATEWVSQGGEIWQLIEPIDGFHPSQVATALMGDFLFKQLLKDKPQWFGKVNPNNEDIRKTFGDQGGY